MNISHQTYSLYDIIDRIDYFDRVAMDQLVWLVDVERGSYSSAEYDCLLELFAQRYGEIKIEEKLKK